SGFVALLEAFTQHSHHGAPIVDLNISHNPITDYAAAELAPVLRDKLIHLQTLDISDVGLCGRGLMSIALSLQSDRLRGLRRLSLGGPWHAPSPSWVSLVVPHVAAAVAAC